MEGAVKNEVTLKSLQTRLEKEKAENSVLARQKSEIVEKMKERSGRINSLQKQIRELTGDKLMMSEHAILRFLQRVELIPVEEIENRVITDELIRCHKVLGNGSYPLGETGLHVVVRNNVISTIK